MDDLLTPDQRRRFEAASTFARTELDDDVADRDARGTFDLEGYRRLGKAGLLGIPIPVAYGGQGEDIEGAVAAVEGLGYGCPDTGLVFALGAMLWTVAMPILAFGTEAQKRRWLPGLCDGTLLGANAASEPEAGSDIFGMTTRAERHGDGWVLNGRKVWITGGSIADLVVVFAHRRPGQGGPRPRLVPGPQGDARPPRRPRDPQARHADRARWPELAFEHCALPADALLEREGRGACVFNARPGMGARRDPRRRPRHDAKAA